MKPLNTYIFRSLDKTMEIKIFAFDENHARVLLRNKVINVNQFKL
jgi:hypothetical protein